MARAIDVIGDAWTLLILRDAFAGSCRFEEFERSLHVSPRVLSSRLRAMVDAGLLRKRPYAGDRRTHQEYVLTEAGEALLPVVHALSLWGQTYAGAVPSPPMTIVHTRCGQATTQVEICSNCGEQLQTADIAWQRPWLEPGPRRVVGAQSG